MQAVDVTSPTPTDVHIASKNTELHKLQSLKRYDYGTLRSLDMTLELRSQVKGHGSYFL